MARNKEIENIVLGVIKEDKKRDAEARENAQSNARYARILQNLAELGGKVFNDDEILFQGDKLIVPEGMTLSQAKQFLEKKEAELEKKTTFSHVFEYRPLDGAHATWQFMKRTFGVVGHQDRMVRTIFGKERELPSMIDVPIDVGKSEQVPWGAFALPFMPGAVFLTDVWEHDEKGNLFQLNVEAPKKFKFEIEGIFVGIAEELRTDSIYRGKAFDGQQNPEFIDLSSVDPKQVVYSAEVLAQLEANVWAQLRHTAEFERQGIPLKRAVLIHGPFGTGKTLAALLTGQEARKAGWTYIKARPGRDNIFQVMQTARLYEPCVVFYEDVDQIADADTQDREGIAQLLDVFDGIEAKGTRILCVLTTNYPEKIHKGMARPGRLDAMIEINELDAEGVEKLVRTRIPAESLDELIDWEAVFEAAREYKPAFVTEFADRTKRYLIARHGRIDGHLIGTEELVDAARGLRPQYEKMVGAKEVGERSAMEDLMGEVTKVQVRENINPKFLAPEKS